jgi:hypothetical protein
MVERKKVGEAERLPVELTLEQRTLILDHTFADPELTERLGLAPSSMPARSRRGWCRPA